MSIKIQPHPFLKQYFNNYDEVEIFGNTVGECIDNLEGKFPGLKKQLLRNGRVRDVYEIYVNGESAYPEELSRRVRDGDLITIITYIAGG